ncbi:lipocalin family protein [Psychroflexus planctonicus]|uniref:Lipocalin-like domain-containing protein n=1 Tax=Psychroflexus planctonicus TaxID=1526575 RepID=A0ABQ1SET9_9FLAO|nr:lipocalin family protein [Psychroflexus planctonicus]GGE28118.1 hypothetical protein GCM10010832_06050 [Psychroflexus planctonicus]
MKKLFTILSLFILFGCEQHHIDIAQLEGYWEISKAENEEGKSKVFQMNENIDYIVLEDSTGIRKKVKPQFSGKFQGSKDVEEFQLIEGKEGNLILKYQTPYDSWNEEIIELTEEKLVVKNNNGITYTYQRYKGLMEFDDEKQN